MIADDLATVIQKKYPGRWLKISVAEDDENGTEIEYPVEEQIIEETELGYYASDRLNKEDGEDTFVNGLDD